jgi:hypothetical protein
MKNQLKILGVLVVVILIVSLFLKAHETTGSNTFHWLGGTGYWSDSSKWENGKVPEEPNDWAYFPDGNYTVFIDNDINISAIVAGDQNVFMSNSVVVTERLFQTEYSQNGGGLFVKYVVGGTLHINSGVLGIVNLNASTLNILPGVSVQNLDNFAGDLTGDGKVDLEDFATLSRDWLKEKT